MHTNALGEGRLLLYPCVVCMLVGRNIDTRDRTIYPLVFALTRRLSNVVYDARRTHSEFRDVCWNRFFNAGASGWGEAPLLRFSEETRAVNALLSRSKVGDGRKTRDTPVN